MTALTSRATSRPPWATPRYGALLEISEEDEHHALIRKFIAGTDHTVNLATRVAALLVLVYGARTDRIHRLTTADTTATGSRTYLALSTEPIEVPNPIAQGTAARVGDI